MKKYMIAAIAFIVLILAFASACDRPSYFPPSGIWRSEEPNIMLDYTRFELGNSGLFVHDEIKIEIHPRFLGVRPILEIYDRNIMRDGAGYSAASLLLSGTFEIIDDRMYYRLDEESQRRVGVEEIIFYRFDE